MAMKPGSYPHSPPTGFADVVASVLLAAGLMVELWLISRKMT
jgi:hypothetical protein